MEDIHRLRTHLDEYSGIYKNIKMRRENGILEVTVHTDGGAAALGSAAPC